MAIKENTMITDWLDKYGDPETERLTGIRIWQYSFLMDRRDFLFSNLSKLEKVGSPETITVQNCFYNPLTPIHETNSRNETEMIKRGYWFIRSRSQYFKYCKRLEKIMFSEGKTPETEMLTWLIRKYDDEHRPAWLKY